MPLPMTSFKNSDSTYTNFIPLINSIECFLPNRANAPEMWKHCLENIVGNIVLFIPFGALLPLISDKFQLLKRVFIVAVLFSLSIELIQFSAQYFGSFRTVDIDDVIFNASGACAGFYVFRLAGIGFQKNSELPAVNL
jgi:glycopeptide antibiotics resistance protein